MDFDQRPQEEGGLRSGTTVSHPTFGMGVVKRREGSGESEKVTVYFNNGLVKVLVVKFANLSVA
jgi:DNA helicase-2/ATP-dependent DNA helicase PcrA